MSPIKLTALLTFAGTLAVASLCVAAYEAVRATEMAGIAASAQSNADATQRQYLASLEYRIARLEEGTKDTPAQADDAPAEDEPVDHSGPTYKKGTLHAEQRLAKRHGFHYYLGNAMQSVSVTRKVPSTSSMMIRGLNRDAGISNTK